MEYFPVKITLSYKRFYLIWCSSSFDKMLSVNGVTPTFGCFENLLQFSRLNQMELSEEIVHFNLDKIKFWCNRPTSQIEPESFLNAWNFFGDVAAPYPEIYLKYEALTQKYIKQYRNLFYSCNLPSINATSKKFHAEWSAQDIKNIRSIFLYGFKICKVKFRINYV